MDLTFHCIFIDFFFLNFCPVRTMNRETTTTIHRLQHEKTHSIGITSSPSSLFIQKSSVHMSTMSTVWVFLFFSLEGGKHLFWQHFYNPGKWETITNLESIWQARGYSGRTMPLVLSERPLSCWPLTLPRCWNEETEFPGIPLSGVVSVSPTLPHTLRLVLSLCWSFFRHMTLWPCPPWPHKRDNQGSLIYTASLGFRRQHKTSFVKRSSRYSEHGHLCLWKQQPIAGWAPPRSLSFI